MEDNSVLLVTEDQLHRIYDTTESPSAMQREVRRVFRETESLGDEVEQARAEGFAAGLFFGTTLTMEMGSLYPETSDDVDANEIIRELEGVETAQDAVNWIHNEYHRGAAHVTDNGPADGVQPYTVKQSIPDGWEYDTRTENGEDENNYLRKA